MSTKTTEASEPTAEDFYDLLAAEMDRHFVFYPLPTFTPTETQNDPQPAHHNPTID